MDSNLDKKIKDFVEKTKRIEKGEKLDLSSNEDLSIGVMNLISIEENKVLIQVKDEEPWPMENNLVYIFAGGELPTEFLKNAGIEITRV